jgi:hypothetical protein
MEGQKNFHCLLGNVRVRSGFCQAEARAHTCACKPGPGEAASLQCLSSAERFRGEEVMFLVTFNLPINQAVSSETPSNHEIQDGSYCGENQPAM